MLLRVAVLARPTHCVFERVFGKTWLSRKKTPWCWYFKGKAACWSRCGKKKTPCRKQRSIREAHNLRKEIVSLRSLNEIVLSWKRWLNQGSIQQTCTSWKQIHRGAKATWGSWDWKEEILHWKRTITAILGPSPANLSGLTRPATSSAWSRNQVDPKDWAVW